MNNAILFGALFVGLSVFHGLGVLGVGSDLFALHRETPGDESHMQYKQYKLSLKNKSGGVIFVSTPFFLMFAGTFVLKYTWPTSWSQIWVYLLQGVIIFIWTFFIILLSLEKTNKRLKTEIAKMD